MNGSSFKVVLCSAFVDFTSHPLNSHLKMWLDYRKWWGLRQSRPDIGETNYNSKLLSERLPVVPLCVKRAFISEESSEVSLWKLQIASQLDGLHNWPQQRVVSQAWSRRKITLVCRKMTSDFRLILVLHVMQTLWQNITKKFYALKVQGRYK